MNILKIMFEINTKIEIKQILDKILKWSGRSKKSNEESKEDQIYSIPKELYGQNFELCRFPTQVLEKIKEMESKIKSMAKEFSINFTPLPGTGGLFKFFIIKN